MEAHTRIMEYPVQGLDRIYIILGIDLPKVHDVTLPVLKTHECLVDWKWKVIDNRTHKDTKHAIAHRVGEVMPDLELIHVLNVPICANLWTSTSIFFNRT